MFGGAPFSTADRGGGEESNRLAPGLVDIEAMVEDGTLKSVTYNRLIDFVDE